MDTLRLTDKIDFGILYDVEAGRYSPEWLEKNNITREKVIALGPSIFTHTFGFEMDGKPIGGICVGNGESHIAVLPQYHGRWGRLWRPALERLLLIQNPIIAKPEAWNKSAIRFLERAKFRRIKEDEHFVTFEGTRELLGL
mgnify:CR=1 FL=1